MNTILKSNPVRKATLLLLPLALLGPLACRAEPESSGPVVATEAPSRIEGTWRTVSYRYGDDKKLTMLEPGRAMLKHMTPTHFTWVDYKAKTRKVTRMAGGTYTLKGNAYRETLDYGSGLDITALLGKPQLFSDRIEGDKWHHQGTLSIGLKIEENWERVQPASP